MTRCGREEIRQVQIQRAGASALQSHHASASRDWTRDPLASAQSPLPRSPVMPRRIYTVLIPRLSVRLQKKCCYFSDTQSRRRPAQNSHPRRRRVLRRINHLSFHLETSSV